MIEVIIPVYNCRELSKALSSLACQTDSKFTVAVIDDCSEIDIKSIADRFSDLINIRYVRNESNIGCGMTRQVGIDTSKADYVTFLDADDILMPYTIASFNEAVEKRPDVQVISSRFYTQENGKLKTCFDQTHCHGKLYQRQYLSDNNICADERVKYSDDSYFNIQCFELSQKRVRLNIPTYIWQRNERSVTFSRSFKQGYISDFVFAIRTATEKMLNFKKLADLTYIDGTVKNILKMIDTDFEIMTAEEKEIINSELQKLERVIGKPIK